MPEEPVRRTAAGQAQVTSAQGSRPHDWSTSAQNHAADLAGKYDTTLREVAESFAGHERCELVIVNHVNDAHSAIARVGLGRFDFFGRPETETAGGGILMGLAAGANDILSSMLPDTAFRAGAIFVAIVFLAFAGFAMCVHGWYRGRLPSQPGNTSWPEKFLDWLFSTPSGSLLKRTRVEVALVIILIAVGIWWWRDHYKQLREIQKLSPPDASKFLGI